MRQQEECEERRGLASQLALLSMLYQADEKLFEEGLRDLQANLDLSSRLIGGPKFTVRHLAKPDGRQRFVLFANGKQFDYFDFTAMIGAGPDGEVLEPDPDDPAFWPFDK